MVDKMTTGVDHRRLFSVSGGTASYELPTEKAFAMAINPPLLNCAPSSIKVLYKK